MNFVKKYRQLIRVMLISLLIIVVVYGLSRNPGMIDDFKQMISPAAFISQIQWNLEIKTIYLLCKHTESVHRHYPSKTALLKSVPQTIQAAHHLRQKDKHTYYFIVNAAGLCESCREHQFFGIQNGKLAVMKGTPIKPGPIQENIQLPVDQLPDSERLDLEKGIPFQSEKEKLQILEGFKSLIAN
ncbi:MAG: BofC C-terminal domain-containing protein [Firmicutes bacterium]|nr:BofC C-terminal domain-containing protein [Bacillota bacterium]